MLYFERDAAKRDIYTEELSKLNKEDLVYLDESGFDHSMHRPFARAKRGQKVIGEVSGKFRKRISMIAGYCQNKFIAPMTFDGYCNTETFNIWLEKMLLPELREGQTIILDNASFHKSKKTIELVESVGCNILFLPPYSPDFNPIEKAWAHIKKIVRKLHKPDQHIIKSINKAFS